MPSAQGILAKLKVALNKVNVTDRAVYKRTITRIGGDDLIGRPASVTHTDVPVSPPPAYQRLGRNIVGNNAPEEFALSSSGGTTQVANDYAIFFSAEAISRDELDNPDLTIVFKDTLGDTEEFRITDYEPQPYQGVDISIMAYLRSTKRPT